jgi:hypothetical protein
MNILDDFVLRKEKHDILKKDKCIHSRGQQVEQDNYNAVINIIPEASRLSRTIMMRLLI